MEANVAAVDSEVVAVETVEVSESGVVVPEGPIERLIRVDATADKDAYQPGEDIIIDLSIENVSGETIQIAPFPPGVCIRRQLADREIRSFPAGTDTECLEPGEVAGVVVTRDQRDSLGRQVTDGYYDLRVGPISMGERSETHDMLGSLRFLVSPPEGLLEKSAEDNESQTVNGVNHHPGASRTDRHGSRVLRLPSSGGLRAVRAAGCASFGAGSGSRTAATLDDGAECLRRV